MSWLRNLRSARARDTLTWIPGALQERELQALANYNAERARGLVHTSEWQAAMAELQARFNAGERAR